MIVMICIDLKKKKNIAQNYTLNYTVL